MPRYDYECQTCHHRFEVKQSFESDPVATCPDCMNGARRVIHSVPVVFKGSGFYVNDYGKGRATKSADSGGSKSDSGKNGKSESKGESGSGAKSETSKEKTSATKEAD